MSGRWMLAAIVAMAAALHIYAVSRAFLPAQDGLKFIRAARAFQDRPAIEVIRGNDRHPLYPALAAAAEPAAALLLGRGPDTWRVSAQLVSACFWTAMLVPVWGLARSLFNDRVGLLAAFVVAILPIPASIGHDTLADGPALCLATSSLWLGVLALRRSDVRLCVASGVAAGLGFWTRPEAAIVAVALGVTGVIIYAAQVRRHFSERLRPLPAAAFAAAFLVLVGGYALVKGEVSEKLAMRRALGLGAVKIEPRLPRGRALPAGLDGPGWDFAAKEESDDERVPKRLTAVLVRVARDVAEGLAGVFAFFGLWGLARDRHACALCDQSDEARALRRAARIAVIAYAALFATALARHAMTFGYLSTRHVLPLVILASPWSAAGLYVCVRRSALLLGVPRRAVIGLGCAVAALLICVSGWIQGRPDHATRWGFAEAGRWVARHAGADDAVLDTRGWASFVADRPAYDAWRIGAALDDPKLRYIVIGADELEADSRRSRSLRAILAHAARPVAEFPLRSGDDDAGVLVYEYAQPATWRGVNP